MDKDLDKLFIALNLQEVSKSNFGFIDTDCDYVKTTLISMIHASKGYISSQTNDRINNINSLINKIIYVR